MLMEYAKSQHFPNPTFFIDDGYSGVEFNNRPGFQRMLAEIEAGHVEVVITKDEAVIIGLKTLRLKKC